MTLCSYKHEEICYEGSRCPLCDVNDTVEALEEVISDLKDEISDLKKELEDNQ